jgi:cytochrome c peroxidase
MNGVTLLCIEAFELAYQEYETCLSIRLRQLPSYHRDIAAMYTAMAVVALYRENATDALAAYEKARQVFTRSAIENVRTIQSRLPLL